MAKKFEDLMDEDEACLNCGEMHYHVSKTSGLCLECTNELYNRSEGSLQEAYSLT